MSDKLTKRTKQEIDSFYDSVLYKIKYEYILNFVEKNLERNLEGDKQELYSEIEYIKQDGIVSSLTKKKAINCAKKQWSTRIKNSNQSLQQFKKFRKQLENANT